MVFLSFRHATWPPFHPPFALSKADILSSTVNNGWFTSSGTHTSFRNHSVTSRPRPQVCLQTSQNNNKGSSSEIWQESNGWCCHFQHGYKWREMEEKLRGQQFRHPTSPIRNSLALNTAMTTFEHNHNFEGTSKVNDASKKICACYAMNRWKKVAAHNLDDSLRNLDPPNQNSLQNALPNHCPNHCTPYVLYPLWWISEILNKC